MTGINCETLIEKVAQNSPYPWGMDPAWKWAGNGLQYVNSLKMKMSVILGVAQMLFGITLKATNDIFFKEPLDFWCEFVPQIIFMCGIFGYMDILIFMKYDTCWMDDSADFHDHGGGNTTGHWPGVDQGNQKGRHYTSQILALSIAA